MFFIKFHRLTTVTLLACWILIYFSSVLQAAEEDIPEEFNNNFWQENTLTGDWGGVRSELAKMGIILGVTYIGETFSNVKGGLQRDTEYLDNLDLTLELDAERLMGWKGATFFFYGLGNHGGDPSLNDGSSPPSSNIEAPDTFKLYEAWIQQNFFDDRLSFKFGLYDLNSEFDVKEVAALFFNDMFGTSPDLSQAGLNSVSIFPVTSVGFRTQVVPVENTYFQFAILDGVPGDPDNPNGTQIIFEKSDGLLGIVEAGFATDPGDPGNYKKIAIGGWFFTSEFDDLADVQPSGAPVRDGGNSGIYAIVEGRLWSEDDSAQGLSAFFRIGGANSNFNQTRLHVGGGVNYTGLIPGRPEDQTGMAVSVTYNGDDFKRANAPVNDAQTILEWTHRVQVFPWLAIQPDIQYIINPSTVVTVDNALEIGLRGEIVF